MKTRLSLFISSILIGLLFSLTPAPLYADGPIESQAVPSLSGCSIFPADNIWNTPVDTLPVDPNSAAYIANIGPDQMLHPDFGEGIYPPGTGGPIGIPYNVVPFTQTEVAITDFLYDDESDPGPYPVPPDALIEGGPSATGDRHVLVMRQGDCKLFEIFNAFPDGGDTWRGDSGAIFDLTSNALRPDTWTSADAAGLPILPGLVRYDEASAGEINHALRFTVSQTRRDYVWPARHFASSSTDPNRPPMGQRFRLKASFVIDGFFSPEGQAILQALKKYGMILADNGSNWYISGEPNEMWDNEDLRDDFDRVKGSDFEAVDSSSLLVDSDSGQAQILGATPGTQGVDPGGVTTYVVSLLDTDSIDTPLTLMTSSPSPSLTLKLSAASINPNGQVTLTVTDTHPAGPITPGILYTVPISATGSGITQTAMVNLLVGGTQVYLPVIVK
jgi:hypothetical protein